MAFNDNFSSGERLDLQTVYFKALLNILDSTPKSTDTFAAFAYYYRVGTFIRIAKIALSNEAVDILNGIISAFTERWEATKHEANEGSETGQFRGPIVPLDAAAITILCANQLLGECMRHLDASGIVRTRKSGALASFGEIDEKGRLVVRLNPENDANDQDEDGDFDDMEFDEEFAEEEGDEE